MADQLAPYLGEKGCIQLIQSFLDPQLMVRHPEPLQKLVLEGSYHGQEREEKMVDHLHQLFTSSEQIGEDFGQFQIYAGCQQLLNILI